MKDSKKANLHFYRNHNIQSIASDYRKEHKKIKAGYEQQKLNAIVAEALLQNKDVVSEVTNKFLFSKGQNASIHQSLSSLDSQIQVPFIFNTSTAKDPPSERNSNCLTKSFTMLINR